MKRYETFAEFENNRQSHYIKHMAHSDQYFDNICHVTWREGSKEAFLRVEVKEVMSLSCNHVLNTLVAYITLTSEIDKMTQYVR